MTVLSLHQLTKDFGGRQVLKEISLIDDNPGTGQGIHGLLGRNGTGKSTVLAILAGQLKPSGGEAKVHGVNPYENRAAMSRTVLAGVDIAFPPKWPIRAIFDVAAVRWPNFSAAAAEAFAADFDLDLGATYGSLSRGQRSMVSIAVGLAARAELTLLDEPYLGLDVHNRQVFYRQLVREIEDHPRALWLATHHIEESAQVLDSVHILGRDGTLTISAAIDDLADAYVEVTGPQVPALAGEISRAAAAGLEKVVAPRASYEATSDGTAGARVAPADLATVVTTLIEES